MINKETTTEEVRAKIKRIREGTNNKKEKCYFCPEGFDEELGRFYVDIDGDIRLCHKRCYEQYKVPASNIRIIVK